MHTDEQLMHTGKLIEICTSASALHASTLRLKLGVTVLENFFSETNNWMHTVYILYRKRLNRFVFQTSRFIAYNNNLNITQVKIPEIILQCTVIVQLNVAANAICWQCLKSRHTVGS
jgi:hypothetical protein